MIIIMDVVGQREAVTSGEDDVKVGIFGEEGTDVAFHLKAHTVDGGGEHAACGVISHQGGDGGCRAVVDLGQCGGVVVHGVEPQLDAGTDDATRKVAVDDEVVGDTGAGVNDEEGMLPIVGSDVGGQTVGTIAARHAAEGAGCVVGEPKGGGQAVKFGDITTDARNDGALNREVGIETAQGIAPRFGETLCVAKPAAIADGKLCAGVSYVNQ